MKYKIACVILAGLMALQCQAGTSAWYLTGEAGVATTNINKVDMDRALQKVQQGKTLEVKDQGVAGSINLGYQLFEHLGVEVGYVDLGKRNIDLQVQMSEQETLSPSIVKVLPESAKGATAAVVSTWQLFNSDLFLAFRLGYLDWQSKVDTASKQVRSVRTEYQGSSLWGGVSLEVHLTETWTSTLNVKRYKLDFDEINLYTMGVIYRF